MWPFVKKRDGSSYSRLEKASWCSWYLLVLVWLVVVLVRIYANLRELFDEADMGTRGKSYPVWETAFPAVTICSQLKIHPERFDFRAHVYNKSNLDQASFETLQDSSMLCDRHVVIDSNVMASTEREGPTLDFKKFMIEVGHSFEDMFYSCSWAGELVNCSEIFHQVITDEWVCYTFNGIGTWRDESLLGKQPPARGWEVNNGYRDGETWDTYPRRSVPTGSTGGLQVLLATEPEKHDAMCKGPSRGFKVQIHNPAETPFFYSGFYYLSPDQEVVLAVEPEALRTNPDVNIKDSFCYLTGRYLAYYNTYNQRNCKLECLANHTWETCGCVGFYMPRDKTLSVCGGNKKSCLINATGEFAQQRMDDHVQFGFDWRCDCYPDCNTDKYKIETSTTDFIWASVSERELKPNLIREKGVSMSRLTVYIKDVWYVDQHYQEIVTLPNDLWMNLAVVTTGFTFLMMSAVLFFVSSISRPGDDPLDRLNSVRHSSNICERTQRPGPFEFD